MENRIFLSENVPFLVVKFSIYLNRRVFVMYSVIYTMYLVIGYGGDGTQGYRYRTTDRSQGKPSSRR